MKNLSLILLSFVLVTFINVAHAQNTFPATGNVGIGTTTPGVDLEVAATPTSQASMRLTKSNLRVGLALSDCNGCWGIPAQSATLYNHNNLNFYLNAGGLYNSTRANLVFTSGYGTNGVTYMIIQGADGNVGIGTTCIPADGKLAVNGKIYATSLQLKLTNGSGCFPDYVFSSSYKLTPLREVEKFILANHHLEGIPTAAQVDTSGINVEELNIKMLEKIEELTLYMIALEKKNEILEKQNTTLSTDSEAIAAKLAKLEEMVQVLVNNK